MRHFGKDTPEFFTFTIGDEETIYKLPLPASMPYELSLRFAEVGAIDNPEKNLYEAMKLQRDVLRRYCGDIADTLTSGTVSKIFEAWLGVGEEETGVTQGELLAASEQSSGTRQPSTPSSWSEQAEH